MQKKANVSALSITKIIEQDAFRIGRKQELKVQPRSVKKVFLDF